MTKRPDERFSVPDFADIVIVTHILELPRDIGLPDDLRFALFEERDDAFLGWSDESKAALLGLSSIPTPGRSPTTRFVFRRRYMPERAQLLTAHAAFDGWLYPHMEKEHAAALREQFAVHMEHGSFGWITAVAATRFLPVSEWPEDPSDRAAVQGAELQVCLGQLNDFLLTLSIARQDLTIRPIAIGELPRMCPVILETAPMVTGERNVVSFPYLIHEVNPHKYGANRSVDELDDEERFAVELARSVYFGDEPWLLFYEQMQQAEAALFEGRHRVAAVDLGTAIEVLTSVALREAALKHGALPADVKRILKSPLRNQLEDHLPKYVGCSVALDDASNPFGKWWLGGYKLRNRVVHDGARPTRAEVHSALQDAGGFIGAVGDALAADPLTHDLGTWLGRYPAESSD